MLSKTVLFTLRSVAADSRRGFGICVPALQKVSDPIQQLFLDKVREYKSKSSGGKMVDPTPEIQRELKNELDRVSKQFGGGQGVDMTAFPEFKFADPKIDAINLSSDK